MTDGAPAPPAAPHSLPPSWSGPLSIHGDFWPRFHRWAMGVLPEWLLRLLLPIFAFVFFLGLPSIRRSIGRNLERVFGPHSWWRRQVWAYRTVKSHAWCLSERYENFSARGIQPEVEGLDQWRKLLEEGQGFVMVTAHVGHWEVGSMIGPQLDGRKVHVIREEERDPRAQNLLQEMLDGRGLEGYQVHFAHGSGPALGAKLVAALRRGEIVALQGDRPRGGGRSARVPFFGEPAPLPVGPAALARAAGVPLLPVFVFREGRRRARVVFRPPIPVPSTVDRKRDLDQALEAIAAEVEGAIRRRPHQWFCFSSMWPPEASPASPPARA